VTMMSSPVVPVTTSLPSVPVMISSVLIVFFLSVF
jgi:hypothetical protein